MSARSLDKSQPPIPLERPLPPLPSLSSHPDLPSGIVVTPSSPRTSNNERDSPSASSIKLIDKEPRDKRSRSLSRSRREAHSGRSSPIGLGLPMGSPATPGVDEARPPALPEKTQSVSSPLPSRGASPAPKIAFAETVTAKDGRGRVKDPSLEQSKEVTIKRARSLSGFLGRSPPMAHAEDPSGKNSQPLTTKEVISVTSDGTAPVKSQGVLGWLGVRKTIRRRQSESKMKNEHGVTGGRTDHSVPFSTANQLDEREKVRSREDVGLETELGEVGRTVRRPRSRDRSPGITVLPQAGSSRVTSIFTRKASSRGPDTFDEISPLHSPVEAQPIPGATLRNSSAFSSQSSLAVIATDTTSPTSAVSQGGTLFPSPVMLEDGTLFGPGGGSHWGPGMRPWMDSMTSGYGSNRSSTSSPLESMPEQEILDMGLVPSIIPKAREGRVRSWSDVPQTGRPPQAAVEPYLTIGSAESSSSMRSIQSSLLTPTRPKLEVRTSSGNSAIIGRMRTAFAKSSGRSRGNPLLRQLSSDVDEFGSLRSDDWSEELSMRPSFSSSSDVASPRLSAQDDPHVALLGLDGDRRIFPNEPPLRSPKMSLTTSVSSLSTGSMRGEVQKETQAHGPRNRPRASTMSNSPSTHSLASPNPPGSVLIAATSPRRRPSAILRLSSGIFGANSASSKVPSSLFPLPPRSSNSNSSGVNGNVASSGEVESNHSGQTSGPQSSFKSITTAMESSDMKQVVARQGEETPGQWLNRVIVAIGRNEIANVLAKR